MKLAVVGTGYVGLVTGTCFAESGNHVTCVDIDAEKVERLKQGHLPIYEPGLEDLVHRNIDAGRLHFTVDHKTAVATADMVFLAVGTPSAEDGSANLSALWAVARDIAPHLGKSAVVVVKSTVPAGTNAELARRLCEATGRHVEVASNPEFLREGVAIHDFMKPDRVVVGTRREETTYKFLELYSPFLKHANQFLVMSPESAEITKYAANAMLAVRISFINEIANLCERVNADISQVRQGIGTDPRIGPHFLLPGVGYGGSCFPKDVRALEFLFRKFGLEPRLLRAVDEVNDRQKEVLVEKVVKHYGDTLAGRTIGVWGLAFKPQTDDIREASSLVFIQAMLDRGARVQAYDPEAMAHVGRFFEGKDDLVLADDAEAAIDGADCLVVITEWDVFKQASLGRIAELLKEPTVFDGRNIFTPSQMCSAGFTYYSIGRADAGSVNGCPRTLEASKSRE